MYHGWIVFDEDKVLVEYQEGNERKRIEMGKAGEGAEAAVKWWDERVGEKIKLLKVPGGLRVYTGEAT